VKLIGERHRHRPRLEIVPMIDVMLLLLVFYILSSLTLEREHGIPVQLPKAQSGVTQPKEAREVTITIDKNGTFYLDKDKITPETVGERVKMLADSRPGGLKGVEEAGVIINADLSVQHRLVVQCMDSLRAIGITQFGIATNPAAAGTAAP
jgi:biopolymer transport protein ExbD